MSNYDYNKGYRWFRFQKDSSIDKSLPPLRSYRSMREVSPLLWLAQAEHVANNERGHVHSDSTALSKSNETASLHLPIILAASISNVSDAVPSLATHSAVDIGENTAGQIQIDGLECPLYVPTPTVLLGSETAGQSGLSGFPGTASSRQSGVKRTPVYKTRTAKQAARKATKNILPNLGSQKTLDDCLFIQNGIQRFPSSPKGFLSEEKEKDINEWMSESNK